MLTFEFDNTFFFHIVCVKWTVYCTWNAAVQHLDSVVQYSSLNLRKDIQIHQRYNGNIQSFWLSSLVYIPSHCQLQINFYTIHVPGYIVQSCKLFNVYGTYISTWWHCHRTSTRKYFIKGHTVYKTFECKWILSLNFWLICYLPCPFYITMWKTLC